MQVLFLFFRRICNPCYERKLIAVQFRDALVRHQHPSFYFSEADYKGGVIERKRIGQ